MTSKRLCARYLSCFTLRSALPLATEGTQEYLKKIIRKIFSVSCLFLRFFLIVWGIPTSPPAREGSGVVFLLYKVTTIILLYLILASVVCGNLLYFHVFSVKNRLTSVLPRISAVQRKILASGVNKGLSGDCERP